jgi:uncharacterized protein (DUF1800 family)
MLAKRAMRRSMLLLGLALLTHAACVGTPSKLKQQHVLNRIGYGPDAWSVARVEQLGTLEAYIEEQLHPELLDDSALEAEIASLYPVQAMSYGTSRNLYNEYVSDPEVGPYAVLRDSTRAKALRCVKSKRQLEQVLVDFWFNHFNVDGIVEEARWGFVTLERDAIRPNVLGNFETMLKATARNPGMLDYLDNSLNFKEGFVYLNVLYGINENYAREIMELHTLGVDGGYTQNDVREVARAFTGWTTPAFTSNTSNGFQYLSQGHDKGEKNIMGVLNLPANRGQIDGDDVIHFLATHPKTAERISRKLCQRFVSETPPEALVQAAAQTFLATNGDLREVMRTILLSPEFLGLDYARTKVKRPFVYMTSLARAVGINDDALYAYYADGLLQVMGEGLYRAGPPTGYPESSRFWSGEGPFVQRINLANRAARGQWGFSPSFAVTGSTPEEIVEQLRVQYLRRGLESSTRAVLVAFVQGLPANARIEEAAALLLTSPDFLVH